MAIPNETVHLTPTFFALPSHRTFPGSKFAGKTDSVAQGSIVTIPHPALLSCSSPPSAWFQRRALRCAADPANARPSNPLRPGRHPHSRPPRVGVCAAPHVGPTTVSALPTVIASASMLFAESRHSPGCGAQQACFPQPEHRTGVLPFLTLPLTQLIPESFQPPLPDPFDVAHWAAECPNPAQR